MRKQNRFYWENWVRGRRGSKRGRISKEVFPFPLPAWVPFSPFLTKKGAFSLTKFPAKKTCQTVAAARRCLQLYSFEKPRRKKSFLSPNATLSYCRTVITICQHQNISQNVLLLFRRPFCSKGQGYFVKSIICTIFSPQRKRSGKRLVSEKANFSYLGKIEQATRVVTWSDWENKAPFFVGKTIFGCFFFTRLYTIANCLTIPPRLWREKHYVISACTTSFLLCRHRE